MQLINELLVLLCLSMPTDLTCIEILYSDNVTSAFLRRESAGSLSRPQHEVALAHYTKFFPPIGGLCLLRKLGNATSGFENFPVFHRTPK